MLLTSIAKTVAVSFASAFYSTPLNRHCCFPHLSSRVTSPTFAAVAAVRAALLSLALMTCATLTPVDLAYAKGEELPATAELDPASGKPFVASFEFLLLRLPQEGRRVTVAAKVVDGRASAMGWGLFLRRYGTSTRLEAFWSGGEDGGTFVFERYEFKPRVLYAATIVADGAESLSLYIQELGRLGEQRETRRSLDVSARSPVKYLGSYPLLQQVNPKTDVNLSIGAARKRSQALPGRVRRVLAASPKSLPRNHADTEQFLDGGPEDVAGKFTQDERLFVWATSPTKAQPSD
ncbi:MAG: hypothetical protein IT290_12235 [Deltaproteobacteria bacterium]|nr:hypothetical protein [Deltaproteobacteria bacterium]